jgi:16S rRNA (guanine527-N7)-methyltransferase
MPAEAAARLNQLLAEANAELLDAKSAQHFATYLTLLQKWNAKTNLTAIRDEEGILSRHFLESILAAHALTGHFLHVNVSKLLDYGSGAGFPGIPIAILRPEIAVTLAESQNKKAAFLREVLRTLDLPNAHVHAGRAETLATRFDIITLRAVDNMAAAIPAAIQLLAPTNPFAHLAILTTTTEISQIHSLAPQFQWSPPVPIPPGTNRILLLGQSQITA